MILSIIRFYFVFSILMIASTKAQENFNFSKNHQRNLNTSKHTEKIHVYTDRSVYTTHEKIWFSAYIFTNTSLCIENQSTVLYVDLLNEGGLSLVNGKFKITDGMSAGYLQVPSDIVSGNFTLVAYSKWMQNFSVESYFKKYIIILSAKNINSEPVKIWNYSLVNKNKFQAESELILEAN